MTFFKKMFFTFTSGRPMIFVEDRFVDIVSGRTVSLYCDAFGRYWLADSGKWSAFRLKVKVKVKGY